MTSKFLKLSMLILLSENKGELKERLPVVNCCVAMAIVRGQIYVFVVTYFVGARYRATIQLNRLILGGTKAVHCIKLQLYVNSGFAIV